MPSVLLINPDFEVNLKSHIAKENYSCFPSIGLGIIASILEKDGHSVEYIDMRASKITLNDIEQSLQKGKYANISFLGMTATTPMINTTHKIASIFKKYLPEIKIIVGGSHASALPEEVLSDNNIDIVVRGEGEYTFKDIVNGIKDNKNNIIKNSMINGISYRDKQGNIIHNKDRPLIENLDELPMPAYHLMPMEKYYPSPGSYKMLPAMSLVVTRGCMGRCTFCNPITKGKMRSRSPEKIVEEIKYLMENYRIKEVCFFDDLLTGIRENVEKMCSILIEKNIEISWSCFTRVNHVEEQLFTKMKKAGCHTVLFGVESGNQGILDKMRKGITLEQVKKAVEICKKIGLETRASYIFGAIGDTKETMQETMNFALNLGTDHAIFTIMTPYPGTEVWKEALRNIKNSIKNKKETDEKWKIDQNYDNYIGERVTLEIPSANPEDIQKIYDSAYKRFYLRPGYALKRIAKMRNLEDLRQAWNGILGLIFK